MFCVGCSVISTASPRREVSITFTAGIPDSAASLLTSTSTTAESFINALSIVSTVTLPTVSSLSSSTVTSQTGSPTNAPILAAAAPPTAPARTTLSSACNIHVSSTSGIDADTCGEASDNACKSIQHGIDRAGDYNTVCVHQGIYFGCEASWAANITQSVMLQGFDAVIDCNFAGGSFHISNVEQVVITGIHIHNAVGESWNNGYAGGVDVINTKNVSVIQCTFTNCSGREAGAIAVHSQTGYGSSNVRTFQDLTIANCDGGIHNTRTGGGGGAGSIAVSYSSSNENIFSGNDNSNNVHTLSNLTLTNSYGGIGGSFEIGQESYGGAAGSISISYYSHHSHNNDNIHMLSNLKIIDSSGGSDTWYGGAAGSISVSYFSSLGNSSNNIHMLSNLDITNSSGGENAYGGAAGSISVSYNSDVPVTSQTGCFPGEIGANKNDNVHIFTNITITNSLGGWGSINGGSAGSISISYWGVTDRGDNNVHTFSNLTIRNSSGGRASTGGGSAGSISISYCSRKSSGNNNVHTLSNIKITNSSGGIGPLVGGAGGSISVSYYSTEPSPFFQNYNNTHILSNLLITNSSGGTHTPGGGAGGVSFSTNGYTTNNTHMISNLTIQDSEGGDSTQGAGALGIQSLGETHRLNVTIRDSVFVSNRAARLSPIFSPLTGVAGAVRIYAKSTEVEISNQALITNTHFRSNSLDATCTGSLCMAGALAVSIPTIVDGCTFNNNTCPRGSGGVYSDRAMELRSCALTNNTATQYMFGTCNLVEIVAVNTSMHFSSSLSGMVFTNLSYDQLMLTCEPGAEIDNSTQRQYTCQSCPSKFANL